MFSKEPTERASAKEILKSKLFSYEPKDSSTTDSDGQYLVMISNKITEPKKISKSPYNI
jgi:hypothetical protein